MQFEEIDINESEKKTSEFLKKVGEIVKEKRTKKNMSQDCLAFNCLTDKSYINKIEKGVYKNITVGTLIKLAIALGEELNAFI